MWQDEKMNISPENGIDYTGMTFPTKFIGGVNMDKQPAQWELKSQCPGCIL